MKRLNLNTGTQFTDEGNIVAPFSSIQNRALVEANCKVVSPCERIHYNGIQLLPNEVGPQNQRVYSTEKSDTKIRFIGEHKTSFESTGHYVTPTDTPTNEPPAHEVTFYGTGLNILYWNSGGAAFQHNVFVDDVSQGTVQFDGNSGVLDGRNYAPRFSKNIVSGLTLGWHTVRLVSATATSMRWQGCEILNETTNQLSVLAGSIFKNGYEFKVDADQTLEIKPSALVADNGARCLISLNQQTGELEQNFTVVGNTPLYLGSADHSEEATVYEIEARDFGRYRSDDFRGGASADKAFSMESNELGLKCQNCVYGSPDSRTLLPNTTGSYYEIRFIGTGIDLVRKDNADVTSSQINEVFLDGVSIGQLDSNGSSRTRMEKLASGLPYGSHSLRIVMQDTAAYSPGLRRFKVYQPKKPSINKQAVELASYVIPATYVKPVFVGDPAGEAISSIGGIMRSPVREFEHTGSWGGISLAVGQIITGFETFASNSGSTFKFNFMGEGFTHYWTGETNNSAQIFIRVNGQLLTDANFPSVTKTYVTESGGAFFPLEGRINQGTSTGNQKGCYFAVENLPFGFYEVEFELQNGSFIRNSGVEIIQPIHSLDYTLGNNSVVDLRNQLPIESSYAHINDSSQTVDNLKNVSQVLETGNGFYIVWYESPHFDSRKNIFIGAQRGDKIVGLLDTARYLSNNIFQTTNSGGAQETSIDFSFKTEMPVQKDIFKD